MSTTLETASFRTISETSSSRSCWATYASIRAAWDAYIEKCRTYRDKFLAHLDSKRTMYPPELDLAVEATVFLGRFLQAHHPEANNIPVHEMDLRVSFDDAALTGKAYFA